MLTPRKILVVDFNADSGALLVRTLFRKFPEALVQLCADSQSALASVKKEPVDAIVLHRTEEEDAVDLVKTLRGVAPSAPIIAVSGVDRSEQVLAAGATGFLNYDEWLRIGTVVANTLAASQHPFADPSPPDLTK